MCSEPAAAPECVPAGEEEEEEGRGGVAVAGPLAALPNLFINLRAHVKATRGRLCCDDGTWQDASQTSWPFAVVWKASPFHLKAQGEISGLEDRRYQEAGSRLPAS